MILKARGQVAAGLSVTRSFGVPRSFRFGLQAVGGTVWGGVMGFGGDSFFLGGRGGDVFET